MRHQDYKWPVGSVHPVYGEVEESFKRADVRYKGFGDGVFVAVQALDVSAELYSLFSSKVPGDILYDLFKKLPPEALDEIEHIIYVIHQENNNKYPEI